MLESQAKNPIFCGGVWKDEVTREDGKTCYIYASQWSTDQLPVLQRAAIEADVTISILAQSGELIPEPYRTELNCGLKNARQWPVIPGRTLVEVISGQENFGWVWNLGRNLTTQD